MTTPLGRGFSGCTKKLFTRFKNLRIPYNFLMKLNQNFPKTINFLAHNGCKYPDLEPQIFFPPEQWTDVKLRKYSAPKRITGIWDL